MNTDWNSPQGDFDTAEKQGELLMLLSRQQVTVHTWDDPDFDYMEEQDLALVVQSPSGTEDLLIELCGEFSVFFEKWHGEYAATAEGYTQHCGLRNCKLYGESFRETTNRIRKGRCTHFVQRPFCSIILPGAGLSGSVPGPSTPVPADCPQAGRRPALPPASSA